jgi:hypothetical protein
MAVAVVQDFPEEETERSTTNYDAIRWESREQYDSFMREVVMPAVMEVTAGNPGREPVVTVYELHNVLLP